MARYLSRTLNLARFHSNSSLTRVRSAPSSSIGIRYKWSQSGRAQLIEIEVDSSSEGADVEVLGLKRLEDAIHSIIIQRAAPSWLIFRPGSSYWVPPKPCASNIAHLVEKLSNPLSEEQSLALTCAAGWPSSSYFLNGNGFPEPVLKDIEGEMHVQFNDKLSISDDEE